MAHRTNVRYPVHPNLTERGGDTGMGDKLENELAKLEEAVRALEQAAESKLLARVKILVRHVMIICENCGGVYRAKPDGLRCKTCGKLIPVTWPDGRTPTAEELRYLLALAYHEAPREDSGQN